MIQVLVKNNDVESAAKALKRKIQHDGVFRALKNRRFFEKPSEKKARKKQESRRRKKRIQYKFNVDLSDQ